MRLGEPVDNHGRREHRISEPMKSALNLDIEVGEDHLVRLPDEVPVGPAEIIVLVEGPSRVSALEDFGPVEPVFPVQLSSLVIEGRG